MKTKTTHIPSGYKPSPFGPIPEDWEVKRLGEVCTFLRTNTLSRNQLNDTDGKVRNIHYGDVLVKYPSIIDARKQSIPFVNKEDYKESMNDFIEDGDIVLADTAEDETVGKACEIANIGSEKILSGLHTMLIRPQKGLFFPCFLGYQVNSASYRKQLQALIQGIKVCSLGKQAIANTYFAVPPLSEQQRIVSVLSLWDTAIEKQTALIEKLTLRKRGLMQQLLTGKRRLKGFLGGTFHRLGNYISECNRRNNGCNRVLSVTNTRGFILQEEQFDKIVASNDTSNYKIVHRGEFAYNPSRVNVGSLAMLNEYDEGILSPMYIVFKANENIDKNYLLQCLQSYWFRGHIPAYTQGSVRDSLSFDGLCSMKFYIPTLQEQKAISAILEHADKEIEIQKQKLATMLDQKKGLMQVLLTGKKRIK